MPTSPRACMAKASMAMAGTNTTGGGSRRRPRSTAMPCTRNQMASAALVTPSASRPWTKLLIANGTIAAPPMRASAMKVPSLRAKKLKRIDSPAAIMRRNRRRRLLPACFLTLFGVRAEPGDVLERRDQAQGTAGRVDLGEALGVHPERSAVGALQAV